MGTERKLFVGHLPPDVRKTDLEDAFDGLGKIVYCEVRGLDTSKPYGFVEFEEQRDADRAFRKRDGHDINGYRIRVEYSRPRGSNYNAGGRGGDRRGGRDYDDSRGSGGGGGYRGGGDRGRDDRGRDDRGGGGRDDRGGGGGGRYGSSSRDYGRNRAPPQNLARGKFRLAVSNLPSSASWQDLKDHMREAGDVAYTDVDRRGSGVVEFIREDDMKYALEKLDGSKLRAHGTNETTTIKLKRDSGSSSSATNGKTAGAAARSSSRDDSRSRSRSRSHSRSKSGGDASKARAAKSGSVEKEGGGGGRGSRKTPTYSPANGDGASKRRRERSTSKESKGRKRYSRSRS